MGRFYGTEVMGQKRYKLLFLTYTAILMRFRIIHDKSRYAMIGR